MTVPRNIPIWQGELELAGLVRHELDGHDLSLGQLEAHTRMRCASRGAHVLFQALGVRSVLASAPRAIATFLHAQ